VVLPAADGKVAARMARSMVRDVANDAGLHPEAEQRITLGIGYAELSEAQDPQALLRLSRQRREAALAAGGHGMQVGPPPSGSEMPDAARQRA
jgi:hypothetical protein